MNMQRLWSSTLARTAASASAAAVGRRGYAFKVDIKALKQLREQTGAGLSKAKEALQHTNNDLPAAQQWIERDAVAAGAKRAAKVAGRVAGDGAVSVHVTEDHTVGRMAELLCETDFVARNSGFIDLVSAIARVASGSAERTRELPLDAQRTVGDGVKEAIGRLGENMVLRRVAQVGGPGCIAGGYVHMPVRGSSSDMAAGRIGALVAVRCAAAAEHHAALAQLARRLAQHVAGYAPRYATLAERPGDCPEELVLEAQQFLFGGGSVAQVLDKVGRAVGAPVSVDGFVRFERAEGVEKPESDFAEEVRQAAGLPK